MIGFIMRFVRTFVALAMAGGLALSGLAGPGAPPASAATAKHDLVFLVDGSGSIDSADWTLQLEGFAAALQSRENFPLDGSMAVSVIQWSSGTPRVEVPLTTLDSFTTRESVIATVESLPQMGSSTHSGDGVRAGTEELLAHGRTGAKKTLCMSTDGERNGGESLATATAFAKANSVDKYTVVAIEDGSFKAASAARAYGPYVFGGGTVTTARTTAEFTGLISGCVAEAVALEALEVTQSIQDLENTVPLVESKRTIVRAYLSKTGKAQQISGRLRGFQNGVELLGSPLSPLNSQTSVRVDDEYFGDRAQMSRTLNFELPIGWKTGSVELSLELPGGVTCSAPGTGTMPCAQSVTFAEGLHYNVNYRGFRWTDDGTTTGTTYDQLHEQHERAAGQLPVGSTDSNVSFGVILVDEPVTSISTANTEMALAAVASAPPYMNYDVEERWYGAIPGYHPGGREGGRADGVGASSWLEADGANAFVGKGRNRVVHELGHTYGLHHTTNSNENGNKGLWSQNGWCGEESSRSAPDWPYWHTTTDNTGAVVDRPTMSDLSNPRLATWGLDTGNLNNRHLTLSDPAVVFPLMSYCESKDKSGQFRWITADDYNHLLGDDLYPIGYGLDANGSHEPSAALVVRGVIDMETSDVEMQPALAFTAALTESDPDGTHEVTVLDADGTALYTSKFTPVVPDQDPAEGGDTDVGSSALIHQVIPADLTGAKTVQVRSGTTVLWSKDMSDSAPTTSIETPTTGSAEDLTINWSSQDADAEALTHTLLYSADSGVTWNLIAIDLKSTSASIPRWTLPASNQARLKVIVSDGLRSTEAISDEFTLPNLAPNVTISDPLDGTTVSGSQTFAMDAQVHDAEDGELENASVVWTSDHDGKLGTGSLLLKRADELTEGTHTLTVTATDTAGAKTADSVTVHVNRIDEVPGEAATCTVDYQLYGSWPGGFAARVTVENTGPDAIDGWSLGWKFADGESVARHWDAEIVTGPSGVSATNLSWNRVIAPGGTVSFGFNGAIDGATPPAVPEEFLLNGERCS